jgi:hypothetical protein
VFSELQGEGQAEEAYLTASHVVEVQLAFSELGEEEGQIWRERIQLH